ncbi:hypothetical protein LTR94_032976, partial [Friedmanniomyces endolithicus]
YVEAEAPLPILRPAPDSLVAERIGAHIAPLIPEAATLQTGLGKIPDAVLRALTGRRGLRIHSGLIGDAVLDLLKAGALAPGVSVQGGVAIGGEYRKETTEATGRDRDTDGRLLFLNSGPDFPEASYESKEVFAELSLPLFRDSVLGEYAELS